MRRFFRRSILWLLPAVILTLGALAVLQYRFLRTLQAKTVSAERNWLRNSLEMVTVEIENRYRNAAKRALSIDPKLLNDPEAAGRHFRRNGVPGARTFFIARYSEHGAHMTWFDAWGGPKAMPAEDEMQAVRLAHVSWHVAYRLDRMLPRPMLDVDERDSRHHVVMQPIVVNARVAGVAGVVLDEERTRKAMMAIGSGVLRMRQASGIALRIGERFPQKMPGGRDFVTQPIGFVFTNWRVGVRDTCASPEEIAAHQFRMNMMWTGSALIVLFGATALAILAMARTARLSQMKSDFVSNVSHELRTPLSSIRVFGEYMRLGRVTSPEKVQQYGEYIEAEGRRLTQLINNILDFSKIESAEKKYHFAETDLAGLVGAQVTALEMPLRDKGFELRFATESVPPLLHIDRDAIAQVLVNLIDNAVKYSGESRRVDVTVARTNGDARVSVRDYGIGIAPAEQKKIFEKFYRVGSGLVHDVKGSGLGLAIVQHVVRAHGGRVEVASAPGEGSTFTIVLPVARTQHVDIPTTEFA
jgi:signal transduction histidine kinase